MHWHSVQTSYRHRLVSNIPTYLQFHWENPEPHLYALSVLLVISPLCFSSLWSSVSWSSSYYWINLYIWNYQEQRKRIFGGWTENCLATWNSWVLLVWICAQKLNPTSCCCGWRTTEYLMMNLSCSGYFVSREELSIPCSTVLNYLFPAIYFPSSLV